MLKVLSKMNLKIIYTERLILSPVTLAITKSLIDGNCCEIKKLGIKTNEN